MQYIYHKVPENLQGDILYPLNILKREYPDMYARAVEKYKDREHVMRQIIPLFSNCAWNDVVFFMAVNPIDLYAARREAGWPDIPPQKFYKIDPTTLDQTKLGVFLFTPKEHSSELARDDFTDYRQEDLEKYTQVPAETLSYFKSELKNGTRRIPLFFRYIPHILYHGEIDVSSAEIVYAH